MKKVLVILVISLLLSGNAYGSKIGKGKIQFSDEVVEDFIKFLRNEYGVSFVVTPDGSYSTYGICGTERCKGGMTTVLKWCKKDTGQKCYVFAQRKKKQKIIRWNKADYIFPKGDWNYNAMVKVEHLSSNNKGIKENISDDQIKSVLNELGFINFNKTAKKEPSQTQDEEYIKWKAQSGEEKFTYKVIHTDTNKIFEGRVRGSTSRSTFVMAKEQAFLRCKNSNEGKKNPSGCVVYDKTQITKKEPSQTQGVATKNTEKKILFKV